MPDPLSIVKKWDEEIKAYEKEAEKWLKEGKQYVERYSLRDKNDEFDDTRFNILYSNVETQGPALFARAPVPVVERRHRDQDPVGRMAATILERAVSTDMEFDEIETIFDQVVLDFQLVGRGVPWVRYEPQIVSSEEDVDEEGEGVERRENGTLFRLNEEVVNERAPVEYVYWRDFGHTCVKNWKELEKDGAVWRRVFFTKKQGTDRFGDGFKKVSLKAAPKGMEDREKLPSQRKLGEVYEIWDADSRKVYWINRDLEEPLDQEDDPLGLESFFPCPRAAYGTLTNDSLIPIPDYKQYRDLAEDLDDITARISVLTTALQVKGIYDASMEGLGSLLNDTGNENSMFPVQNLAALLSKGSTGTTISNVVQFMPIDMIAAVLLNLYDAKERLKRELFEISGISDIIRGTSDPRETAQAQRIKGQFATLRLDKRQAEISRVARDVIRIKSEIIAEQFSPQILREISGFDQLPEIVRMREEAEDQQQQASQQFNQAVTQAQQSGDMGQALSLAQQGVPDLVGRTEQEIDSQFFRAVQLIKDDKSRGFRIDIETDSTVAVDEEEAKQSRVEFLGTMGKFIEQAVTAGQSEPQLAGVMGQFVLFAARGFKAGRNMESAIEDAVEKLEQASKEPKPDLQAIEQQAKEEEAKIDLEAKRADVQAKQALAEIDIDKERQKAAIETEKAAMDLEIAKEEFRLKQAEHALSIEELKVKRAELLLEAESA